MLALAAGAAVVLSRWVLQSHTGNRLVSGGKCNLCREVYGHTRYSILSVEFLVTKKT